MLGELGGCALEEEEEEEDAPPPAFTAAVFGADFLSLPLETTFWNNVQWQSRMHNTTTKWTKVKNKQEQNG